MSLYYNKELKAIKKRARYRQRELVDDSLVDFASNDYLGLSHNKTLHEKTCKEISRLSQNSSKASLLVNGYHKIHRDFEETLKEFNGFEDAVILGSGFNANIALIDALVRKGDELFMDELYHASGILASQIDNKKVKFFKHNDIEDLENMLLGSQAKRKIVAVEGIYSMDGDLVKESVFELCDKYDAILIVDEAHSSGVVGENLMGVYDLYNIKIRPNHIKMGTLGKAYGSFGAYILGSEHIVEYLINRAKPIIYATSLSLYDTLLAHNALRYIRDNKESLKEKIESYKEIVEQELGIKTQSLIVPINIGDNAKVMKIKEELKESGYAVGAIRQPTVKSAIIRLIARLGTSESELRELCMLLNTKREI
ncbi:MAG: pyridoxal phosphate-dependent aminotransferase family protein [Sulfurimonas sp.]|uniref:aminotransferase class I/II-fold pyridoxal phosphate-dependent enzyme n=1 Tax=Sulfurimonas sp. TaxID=2022749 RepID=UPI0025FE3249|nr:pyridoxal phosphate-dependent aminotransferase family protein [Sulfurimonas sp.]MCK9491282.1 pyridoxal phosphate-dependent aminotransferase family protein [Sulfurimonas sp.]